MPIIVTYDLAAGRSPTVRQWIRKAFELFGWELIADSTFRYPKFGHEAEFEDWLNHVVPALHFFRSIVLAKGITLKAFTLTSLSSSCFKEGAAGVVPPRSGENLPLLESAEKHLEEQKLKDWVQSSIDELS